MEDLLSSIVVLGILAFILYCYWKVFEKAGRPGWESLIPFYNIYIITTKIAKLPWWYLLLFFIPIANIYAIFKIYIEFAKNFGKSTLFGVLLVFFAVILIPVLALGDAQYVSDEKQLEDNLVG